MGEYYDYDLERRKQRSLAEENLNEQLLGMIRTVRKPVTMVHDLAAKMIEGNDSELKQLYDEIKNAKENIENMKEDVLTYLARLGNILFTSNLYRDLFLGITRAAQIAEGIAYRVYLLTSNTGGINNELIMRNLAEMTNKIRNEYAILENAAEVLTTNPKKSYEITQNVSSIEDEIDTLYRKLAYMLYRELKHDLVTLMLMRDIVDMIEELADTLRDVAEDIKFLALFQAAKA